MPRWLALCICIVGYVLLGTQWLLGKQHDSTVKPATFDVTHKGLSQLLQGSWP